MSDKKLIETLGDAKVLAKKLGYSVQRVQNWKKRGIPAKVKLEHADLFLSLPTDEKNNATNP